MGLGRKLSRPSKLRRCGHCKNMAEAYKDAAAQLKAKGSKVTR